MNKTTINKKRAEAYEFFKLLGYEGNSLAKLLNVSVSTLRRNNGFLEDRYHEYKNTIILIIKLRCKD